MDALDNLAPDCAPLLARHGQRAPLLRDALLARACADRQTLKAVT